MEPVSRAGTTASDVRNLDVSVAWAPQHRVNLQLVNADLPGGLVVVDVYLTTAIGYSEQNIAFFTTLGRVLQATSLLAPQGDPRATTLDMVRTCPFGTSLDQAGGPVGWCVSRAARASSYHRLTSCVTPVVRSARTLPLHLKHVCDDALRAIAMIMTPWALATAPQCWHPSAWFWTRVVRIHLRWTRRAVTSSW